MLTGNFISGPDAPGAQIESNCSPINYKCSWLNVGKPLAPRMLFGMTNFISKTQCLFTYITFDSQF
jgi:hypothetical protein